MIKKKTAKKTKGTALPRQRQAKKVDAGDLGVVETSTRLGASLQKRRVQLGLTQKAMAELCHLQVATILKIEKGDPGVRLGTLQTYLEALNLTLELADKELM